jgi:hypothetical protein
MLRASLDGKTRAIWASGLRDTIGWGGTRGRASCGGWTTASTGWATGSRPKS